MRRPAILIILSLLLAGCGGGGDKRETTSAGNSTMSTETRETELTKPETPSPATKTGEPPVEFAYLGVSPDKATASYQIKVKTGEPISQVDLDVTYLKADGSVLEETTFAWQNIVKSVR